VNDKVVLSEWIILDGDYATRIILDTDVKEVKNRIAFIEKTPRIRVLPYNSEYTDWTNWYYNSGLGSCDRGLDQDARDWCDQELIKRGYTLL
jgi:hypothetical protein